MDYREKLKELRTIVPVPLSEALILLKDNDGDVQKSAEKFKEKSIAEISFLTGCDTQMANHFYAQEKYDFNRTFSAVREKLFDIHYKPIEGLTLNGLRSISEWTLLISLHDFPTALDYSYLQTTIDTLALLPDYKEMSEKLSKAKTIQKKAFEGYTDDNPIEDFVRRHQQIDDDSDFQSCASYCTQRITLLEHEVARHKRNLTPQQQ